MNEAFPLPQVFIERMRQQLTSEADAYFLSLHEPFCRGIRLSRQKQITLPSALCDDLISPIPWCSGNGYYLKQDSPLGSNPLHDAGAYYLQEPSAMAPVAVLHPQHGERILDLCAAPGGKSTQIADCLEGSGLLVSNEPVPNRAKVLSRNIERMGITNALVVSAQPEHLAALWAGAFDAILVDAPCSGEGMFRRHPETRHEWNEHSSDGCAARQRHILASAYTMLKPGGRLVYSTCTLNLIENEETAAWFLGEYADLAPLPFTLPIQDGHSLSACSGMLHLYPHQIKGEGHFIAAFQKAQDGSIGTEFAPASARLKPASNELLAGYRAFAADGYSASTCPSANAAIGSTLICAPDLPPLASIKVLRAGLQLGGMKGKVFTPDHALAMALPHPYSIPTLPLSHDDAVLFQHGQTLPAPESLKGYALATYEGIALGFGKASNAQLKNHYPKGLRRP